MPGMVCMAFLQACRSLIGCRYYLIFASAAIIPKWIDDAAEWLLTKIHTSVPALLQIAAGARDNNNEQAECNVQGDHFSYLVQL